MRLFFALACPAHVAEQITNWRNGLALEGQPVSSTNLHVTLAFLGQQPDRNLAKLLQIAASIEAEPFTLKLDQLGFWADGLLHLAPASPCRALLDLSSQLQRALQISGIKLEQQEYRPHLTLARHCRQPVSTASPAFSWKVSAFTLFLSRPEPGGVRYEALASWALRDHG